MMQTVRRVGKYEVGRTLGEGTFAKVKFAVNTETGESVAMKILDKEKILKHKMVEQVSETEAGEHLDIGKFQQSEALWIVGSLISNAVTAFWVDIPVQAQVGGLL